MSLEWHIALAKPNHDHHAARELRELSYADVYVAKRFWTGRGEKGRPAKREEGLRFPGYVFVLLDADRGETAPLRNLRGLRQSHPIMCNGNGNPSALHHGGQVIADLRSVEDAEFCGASIVLSKERKDLTLGARVKVEGRTRRDEFGDEAPLEGYLLALKRGKARILCGTTECTVDEDELTEVPWLS